MTHSGHEDHHCYANFKNVLIPLLLDDPLWAIETEVNGVVTKVLIPLLLDDPLWDKFVDCANAGLRLNPSFAG